MLTIFRRHLAACRFKSRRDRNCKCPIHIEGKLGNDTVRRALETRDWNTANAIMHRWERQGYIGAERDAQHREKVADAVASYLSDCEARHLSPLTLKKYRATLCGNPATRNRRKDIVPTPHLIDWCAARSIEHLDELTLERLREYRGEWKDSKETSRKRLENLRGFWKFCAASKWVALETFTGLKAPGKGKPIQKQPYTVEEMKAILDACDTRPRAKQLRALVLLMRYSGHRIQAAVTCPCASLSGDKLFLRAMKSGAPVTTILPAVAVDALRECPRASQTHWFSYGAEGETDAGHWSGRLKLVFEAAGIKGGHSHRLRHTFAVSLLQEGASVAEVATLMGNSSAVVEKHYSSWVKSRQDALEALQRRMHQADPLAAAPERKVLQIRGGA